MTEATQKQLDEFLASQQETTRVRYAVQDFARLWNGLQDKADEMAGLLENEKINPDLRSDYFELVEMLARMVKQLGDDRDYLAGREHDDQVLLSQLNASIQAEQK